MPAPFGRRQRRDLKALAAVQKVLEDEPAFAFGRAPISLCQNPAEPAISLAILRIGERVRAAVDEDEARAGNDPCGGHRLNIISRERVRAHNSGERVAVGDPDPGELKLGCARDHLLGMRRSAQEREIRRRRQFGEPRLKLDQRRRSSRTKWADEGLRFRPDHRSEPG